MTTATAEAASARTAGLSSAPASSMRNGAASLRRRLALWRARHGERRHLLEMDDRELRDIGITRYDALNEGTKPWWRS